MIDQAVLAADSVGAVGAGAIALVSSVIGASAAVVGSRWATRQDLLERNRHALLMEDVPRYQRAVAGHPDGAKELGDHLRDVSQALDQIEVRTQLLGGREATLGQQLSNARVTGKPGDDLAQIVVEIWAAARARL